MKTDYEISKLSQRVEALESCLLEQIRNLQNQVEFLEEYVERLESRLKNMRNEG